MFHLNELYTFFFFFWGLETLVSGFCVLSVCSSVRFDVSVKDGDGRKCFSPPKGFLFLKVFVLFLWLWILLFFRFLVKTRHNSQRAVFHFSASSCKKASCSLTSPDFILPGCSRDAVRLWARCQHDKSRLSGRASRFDSNAAARRAAPPPSEQTLNSSTVSPNGSVAVKIKVAPSQWSCLRSWRRMGRRERGSVSIIYMW